MLISPKIIFIFSRANFLIKYIAGTLFTLNGWRKIVLFLTIAIRVITLLIAPLAGVLIVAGLLSSAQGGEILVLSARSHNRWIIGSLACALWLSFSTAIAASFILHAYKPRLIRRLSESTKSPDLIAKKITAIVVSFFLCLPIGLLCLKYSDVEGSYVLVFFLLTVFLVVGIYKLLNIFAITRLFEQYHFGLIWIGLFVAITLSVGTTIAIYDPLIFRELLISMGPLAITFFSLSYWILLFSLFLVAIPLKLGLTSLILAPLLLVGFWGARQDYNVITPGRSFEVGNIAKCGVLRDAHYSTVLHTLEKIPECGPLVSLKARFKSWILARNINKDDDFIPVFLVSAEGGGIRAAYWTSQVMARINEATKGQFLDRTFAISGVSGGSLGMLAVADTLRKNCEKCKHEEYRAALSTTFRKDLLSPVLYSLLLSDIMRNLIGTAVDTPTRSQSFEQAISDAWKEAYNSDGLSKRFIDIFGDSTINDIPVLMMNATTVETGHRFIISNALLSSEDYPYTYTAFDPGAPYDLRGLSAVQAAHLSARFLYISPSATLRAEPSTSATLLESLFYKKYSHEMPIWGHLVDGGYFENSGTSTLLDTLMALNGIRDEVLSEIADSDSEISEGTYQLASRLLKVRFYGVSLRNDPFDFDDEFSRHPSERSGSLLRQEFQNYDLNRYSGRPLPQIEPPYIFFKSWNGFTDPAQAMLATRSARGTAARRAFAYAINGSTNSSYNRCNAFMPKDSDTSRFLSALTCEKYGGRWLEFNLAQMIADDHSWPREKKGCDENNGPRPALGWVMATESADLIDCLLKKEKGVAKDLFDRIEIILGATERTSMDKEAYLALEGWEAEWNKKVEFGIRKIEQFQTKIKGSNGQ